jgi:hypothetical protein
MKIIKLQKGDRIVATLEEKLAQMKIDSGFLWGIGAISSAELMAYKLDSKKYLSKKISGTYETLSFMATITKGIDRYVMIHPHIVLADENFNCLGGHLKEGIVAATLEIAILSSEQKLERYYDKKIGLNLIK